MQVRNQAVRVRNCSVHQLKVPTLEPNVCLPIACVFVLSAVGLVTNASCCCRTSGRPLQQACRLPLSSCNDKTSAVCARHVACNLYWLCCVEAHQFTERSHQRYLLE